MNRRFAPLRVSTAHSGPSWSTTDRMFGWVVVVPGAGPGPGAKVPYNGAVSPEPKALTWSWVRSGPWRISPGLGSSVGRLGLGGGGSPARAAAPGRPARARAASDAA